MILQREVSINSEIYLEFTRQTLMEKMDGLKDERLAIRAKKSHNHNEIKDIEMKVLNEFH
jgi:hypothetical protein